jgi:hypothetical protein
MMSALQLVGEYFITGLAFIVTCVGLVVTLLVLSSTLPGNPIEKSPNRIIFGASVAALTFVYSFFFTGLILKEKIPDENPLAYSLIIAAVVSVGFGIVWHYMFSKMMMR